jgi:hypothetical protein
MLLAMPAVPIARGIEIQFGLRLQQIFQDAGLPAPDLKCDAFIGSGPGWGWYDQMLHAAQNAIPAVLPGGITTADRRDWTPSPNACAKTVANQRSVTRAIDLISAWTRTAPAQQ